MTGWSRRRLLRTVGLSVGGGLAGCTAPRIDRRDERSAELDRVAAAQFRHGLKRHGYQPVGVPDAVTVDWVLPAVNTGEHTAAKATPVAAPNGEIIIPGDTGTVYAVTPDGTVQWTAETEAGSRGIHGTPAIANGAVYIGAYDGALYAFDLVDGTRLWRASLGDAIGSSPAYYEGLVYIAVEHIPPDGTVFAVDAASGEVVWKDARPQDHPHSTIAIDRDAGRLVVGANDGVCYAWSFPELEFQWRFETGGPIKGPVGTADGRAYLGSWDETVYCLDLQDGSMEWEFETDGGVMSGPAIDPAGTVFMASQAGTVYAIDGATGADRWQYDVGASMIGSPTATPDHVLIGGYDARLYAIDKTAGEKVWSVEGNGHATSAALVRPDGIYYAERSTATKPGNAYKLTAA